MNLRFPSSVILAHAYPHPMIGVYAYVTHSVCVIIMLFQMCGVVSSEHPYPLGSVRLHRIRAHQATL